MVKTIAVSLLLLSLMVGRCAAADELYYSIDDFYRVPKIDMHMHLHSTGPAFMAEAKADNFRVLSINVDYSDFPPIDEQQKIAETLLKNYPDRFAFAATFSVKDYDQPGWAEAANQRLDQAVRHGAVAV